MDILFGISTGLIVIGTLFKIQHYPLGNFAITMGFVSNIAFSGVEIRRLRKIVKENGYKE
jgi:threonine/homoserine efflux transporter RhtA